MGLKFLPFSMYAEGFVKPEDIDVLESYINEDILNISYDPIESEIHNFFTTSPGHGKSNDNIDWSKYKKIFLPYIENFITTLTDNVETLQLKFYLNLCQKNSFIAPHVDNTTGKTSFMMLYCPQKTESNPRFTTYLTSEKYHQTFSKFEKMPMIDEPFVNLMHEKGKYYILPANLLHWVTTVTENIDRITLMASIEPKFK